MVTKISLKEGRKEYIKTQKRGVGRCKGEAPATSPITR
jgi:hypothetical protein